MGDDILVFMMKKMNVKKLYLLKNLAFYAFVINDHVAVPKVHRLENRIERQKTLCCYLMSKDTF